MGTQRTTSPIPVAAETVPCGCDGQGCDEHEQRDTPMRSTQASTSVQSLMVTGMTCQDCVGAVTRELEALEGIRGVHVYLDVGGSSAVTLTGTAQAAEAAVRKALSAAGSFRLEAVWTD